MPQGERGKILFLFLFPFLTLYYSPSQPTQTFSDSQLLHSPIGSLKTMILLPKRQVCLFLQLRVTPSDDPVARAYEP